MIVLIVGINRIASNRNFIEILLSIMIYRSKQIMQMDIDEELLRERENDIVELTRYIWLYFLTKIFRLMTEMNAMAKLQAKYIQEQGEDLGEDKLMKGYN